MSANDTQVGGTHYKQGGEEHWDRQWRLHGRGYFVGAITKYVERYHLKNGLQDLRKAKHFLEKLIELESVKEVDAPLRGETHRDMLDNDRFEAEIAASRRREGGA